MSGQSIALATKGVICKAGDIDITTVNRFVLPFNLNLQKDLFPLNLTLDDIKNLNLKITENQLNIKELPSLKINSRLPNSFKLNLKKCED